MDVHLGQELLDELGSSLENLETQQSALLQFLKEKGIVTDEQLAPYLTQAGNASNVRWRAARLRLERLLSGAQQEEQEARKRREDHAVRPQMPPVESDEANRSTKVSTKTGEEKKTEERKAKPSEKDSESVESSEAKTRDEAKPSPKDPEEDAA
jgi:hypothetical protein